MQACDTEAVPGFVGQPPRESMYHWWRIVALARRDFLSILSVNLVVVIDRSEKWFELTMGRRSTPPREEYKERLESHEFGDRSGETS